MKIKYLHLTGGLGNQLFQLAAGLFVAQDSKLIISEKNGVPRTSSLGEPELFSFELPDNVGKLGKVKVSPFVSKTCGYIIRMGVSPSKFERISIIEMTVRFCASVVNSIYFKNIVRVVNAKGVGYSEISTSSNFLIGYFQSYKYAERPDVLEKLQQLRLKKIGPDANELIQKAKIEEPLVIHLRRGDYASESSFGLLGGKYYLKAARKLYETSNFKAIWVFTDDLTAAKSLFDNGFELPIRFISNVDNSAASSLEVMRHGKGFIIGNSSFSWWAAFLRYDVKAKVIAPYPWFIRQEEPDSLIPPSWERLNGNHFLLSPLQLEGE